MSLLTEGSDNGQSGAGQTQDSGNPNAGQGITQNGTASWRDALPEELKNHGGLAQFQDVPSLAKSYVHAQSLIGKKGVIVPGEKATEEEMNAFFDGIGRPALDKYEVKAEGMDENFLKAFKEHAHKMGVLPKQAQGFLEWYKGKTTEAQTALKEAKAAETKLALDNLKKEWGQGYDKEIAYAKAAVSEAGPEFAQYLEKSGLGDDPGVIKAMSKLGRFLGEDKLRGMGTGSFGKTPSEIQGEINSIMGNPAHPYFDASHPGHKSAVDNVAGLYKQLNSQGKS